MTNKSVWGIYKSAYNIPMPPMSWATKEEYLAFLDLPQISTPSACAWYRIKLPFKQLALHNWKADCRFGYPYPRDEDWNLVTIQQADNPIGMDLINMLAAEGNPLIYETDDNVFETQGDRFDFARYGVTAKGDEYEYHTREELIDTTLKVADMSAMITVTTPYLADIMRQQTGHHNIKVLPNCVPADLLTLDRNRNRRKLVVGWQGGRSHLHDVDLIIKPLANLLAANKKAEAHIFGGDEKIWAKFPDARISGWVLLDDSYRYYRSIDFDIMLVPLLEDEFNRSKSPIKVIEAMALGIPVICSDHPVYQGVVIDGVTGFLVQPDEFEDRLQLLANDSELREIMSRNAREIAQDYTIEANWDLWDKAYEELL
jgi:glycosyltransferase involved in cell wall biosynthesis